MAIYVVGQHLIRARDGHHALEISGLGDANIFRVTEEGEHGFIRDPDTVAPEPDDAPDADDEVEVTQLSDRNLRKFKNKKSGKIRTEEK